MLTIQSIRSKGGKLWDQSLRRRIFRMIIRIRVLQGRKVSLPNKSRSMLILVVNAQSFVTAVKCGKSKLASSLNSAGNGVNYAC